MKKTTLVLSLLITSIALQAQKKPVTIFEVFGVANTPCAPQKEEELQVAGIMDAPGFPDAERLNRSKKELIAAESRIAQHFINLTLPENTSRRSVDFSKGGYMDQSGDSYTLYSKDGRRIWTKDFFYIEKGSNDREGFNVYNSGPLTTYYDQTGKLVSEDQFEYMEHLYSDYFRVLKDNKWGIILRNGKQVLPVQYDYLSSFTSNNKTYYILSENGQDYYLAEDLKTKVSIHHYHSSPKIIQNRYWLLQGKLYDPVINKQLFCGIGDYLETVGNSDIFRVQKGNEIYYFDIQGKLIGDNKISSLNPVDSATYIATMRERKDTLINKKHAILYKYALVKLSGNKIQWITKPDYYALRSEYRRDFLWFSTAPGNYKYGLLDKKGKTIIPAGIYNSITTTPRNNMVLAVTDSTSTLINTRTGKKTVLPQPYIKMYPLDEKLNIIAAETKERMFALDSSFTAIKMPDFKTITFDFSSGLYAGYLTGNKNNQKLYFDKKQQVFKATINDTVYDSFTRLTKLNNGRLFLELPDGRNFIELGKNKYLQTMHKEVSYDNTARWYIGRLPDESQSYGTFDSTGTTIIPFVCTHISKLSPGSKHFNISLNYDNTQWITTKGNIIFDLKYENVSPLHANLYTVTQNGLRGVVDENDKVIVPVRYHYISLRLGKIMAMVNNNRETFYLKPL